MHIKHYVSLPEGEGRRERGREEGREGRGCCVHVRRSLHEVGTAASIFQGGKSIVTWRRKGGELSTRLSFCVFVCSHRQ